MVTDIIGDYLTRIRNAQERKKKEIRIPSSKMLVAISEILKNEGFIQDYKLVEEEIVGTQKNLLVELKYEKGKPVIRGLKRVSKPGVRNYIGYRDIPKILSGLGIAIVTTPKGVLTGEMARKEKVGGEYLCKIW